MTDNFIGRTIYVAESAPATNDDTGFEALTWVQVKGAQTLFQLGVTHENIDVPDLGTGFTSGVKGMGTGQESTATFRDVVPSGTRDAGQEDIIDLANAQRGIGSVKIVKGSGTDSGDGPAPAESDPVEYAQGYFHSYVPNQPDGTTHEGFSITFKQNKPTVNATEPAA